MLQKKTSHDDILDAPLEEEETFIPHIESFKLIYIELVVVVYTLILILGKFLGPSTSIKQLFIIVLYCCIAPFVKPQFTKESSLKIALGLWNCCNIGLLTFVMLSGPGNHSNLLRQFIFISFSVYYISLPFVETKKLWNQKFYTILSFSLSFNVLFLRPIFDYFRESELLLVLCSFMFAISAGISMLSQLKVNNNKYASYYFYLPRLALILALAIFNLLYDKFKDIPNDLK